MKNILFLLFLLAISASVFAQSQKVFLETEELKKDQIVGSIVSQDGSIIVTSKFSMGLNMKAVMGYPDFSNPRIAPTTLVVDTRSGRLKKTVKGFVAKVIMPGSNNIVGITTDGVAMYDWKSERVVPLSGIPEFATPWMANNEYLISASAKGLKVVWNIGKITDGRYTQLWTTALGGFSNFTFKPDGETVMVIKTNMGGKVSKIEEFDLFTGILKDSYSTKEKGACLAQFTKDGSKLIHTAGGDIHVKSATTRSNISYIKNDIKGMVKSTFFSFNDDASIIVTASPLDGTIKIWNSNGMLINEFVETKKAGLKNPIATLASMGNNDHFLVTYKNGVSSILSIKQEKIVGKFYFDIDDWAVIASDGRMDGTEGAFEKIFWHDYNAKEKISLTSTFDQMYTPKLVPQILTGLESKNLASIEDMVKYSPSVSILTPDSITTTSEKTITLKIQAIPKNQEPVRDIIVYVNGKAMASDTRGFKMAGMIVERTVTLQNGENIIKAEAVSERGFKSSPDQVIVTYNGVTEKPNLHMLIVGLNLYKNPKYNLNYALADANSFKSQVENGSGDIFDQVNLTFIKDSEVTRDRIVSEFANISAKTRPEDVFVFYYAGHGVMSEDDQSQFYIVPYDVTQLYSDNVTLGAKAVSAEELKQFSTQISAQKQLYILDACQSGGMTEMLAMRGAAEEKAIAQLARSTGTYWLTASGSEQFATEFETLGHGLFTYTLLEALSGKADGGSRDKKITVKELSAYLNDRVPELSEQHKGQAQYPTSYGFGQDFPIVVVE